MSKGYASRVPNGDPVKFLQGRLDDVRDAIDSEQEGVINKAKALLNEAYYELRFANEWTSLNIEEVVHDLLSLLAQEDLRDVTSTSRVKLIDHQFDAVD